MSILLPTNNLFLLTLHFIAFSLSMFALVRNILGRWVSYNGPNPLLHCFLATVESCSCSQHSIQRDGQTNITLDPGPLCFAEVRSLTSDMISHASIWQWTTFFSLQHFHHFAFRTLFSPELRFALFLQLFSVSWLVDSKFLTGEMS